MQKIKNERRRRIEGLIRSGQSETMKVDIEWATAIAFCVDHPELVEAANEG
jgi:hypothetical protein